MLEHGVKAQYHEPVDRLRDLVQLARLRDRGGNAAGAQHLEGVKDDDAAAQALEGERLIGVEPAFDDERRGKGACGVGHMR